jgi:hypothetical protein
MAINLLFYVIKNRFKKSIKIVLSPFFVPIIPSFVGAGFQFLFFSLYSACSFPFHFFLVMDTRSSICYLTTEHTSELVQSKRGQAKGSQYRGYAVSTYIHTYIHTYVPSVWTACRIHSMFAVKVYTMTQNWTASGRTRLWIITNASDDWIFEVLTAVRVKIQILWDMTSCILVMYMPPSSRSK